MNRTKQGKYKYKVKLPVFYCKKCELPWEQVNEDGRPIIHYYGPEFGKYARLKGNGGGFKICPRCKK
jgi:hypothetical protein